MKIFLSLLTIGCLLTMQAASAILSFSKTAYEQIVCSVDFGFAVGTDTIALDSIIVTDAGTQQNLSASIIASAPVPGLVPGTKKIAYAVKSGIVGHSYIISVRVNDTTTAEKFEGVVSMKVQ